MRGRAARDLALVLAAALVLVVGDQVCDGNKIIAVGGQCEPGPRRRHQGVAVVAALLAEVAGLASRAFVDGVDLGGLGGSAGCCPAAAPGGLAAGVGTPSAASRGGET